MNKNILSVSILAVAVVISGVIAGPVFAQTQGLQPQEQKLPGDIQFPIPELGNCASKEACKTYCDDSKNADACLAFAEKRNLLSPEELATAKKFNDVGMIGPGGCKGKDSCDAYCGKAEHMEECITFAQKNGLMSGKELEESQKVLAAIKKGIKPPACSGPADCDKYCSSAAHMEECMNFSIEAGLMDQNKIDESKKVLAALKKGVKMPACNGQQECDSYCASPAHMEECMSFAIEAGLMPPEESQKAQKALAAIKQGIKPPACKGEKECQDYCSQDAHVEECIKFAVATGEMTEKDAQTAIKTGGKGPGGCKSKDACEAFCNNPDNQQTCFEFGRQNGLIPADDLKKMEEGQQKMKETLSQAPQEVLDCLTSALGVDAIEKMKTGSGMPGKDAGEQMGKCFGQFKPGPGEVNPGGQTMPPQAGPGGCKSPEECQSYCASNPEVCKNFQPQQNQQGRPGGPNEGQGYNPGSGVNGNGNGLGGGQGVPAGGQGNNNGGGGQSGWSNGTGNGGGHGSPTSSGQQMPPKQTGPGGCSSPEECESYCESHRTECGAPVNQMPPQNQGQMMPGQQAPDGNNYPQYQINVPNPIFDQNQNQPMPLQGVQMPPPPGDQQPMIQPQL